MSKFFNYVRKFLALSFMSATAAFLMSCNSNVEGIVQKVEITDISDSMSEKEQAAVSGIMGDSSKYKVYKANKDTKNSVLYAVPEGKQDESKYGKCTAVVMEDGATVNACIGSETEGGKQQFNVGKVEPADANQVNSITLDSWDEPDEQNERYIASETWANNKPINEFRAINLSKQPRIWEEGKSAFYVEFDGNKNVYDSKTKTYLAASASHSAMPHDLKDGLYASSDDTWADLLNANFENIAVNTGAIKKDGADLDLQTSVNVKEPTKMTLSYEPAEGNTYYKSTTLTDIILYPLRDFSKHVWELCHDEIVADDAENGYADQCKAILGKCISEYSKLSNNAKNAEEVNLTVDDVCTPTDVLKTCLSSYILAAAVRDLCEYKNGKNPSTPCTEEAILQSIDNKKLSSNDKQYLLERISANYNNLNKELGEEFKNLAKSSKNDLIKEISEIPADDSSDSSKDKKSSEDSSGGSSGGSSRGSSGGSSGSSSGRSSGSSSSSKSASIKTGSESLLMLVFSFGLSSGALLSLRKRK